MAAKDKDPAPKPARAAAADGDTDRLTGTLTATAITAKAEAAIAAAAGGEIIAIGYVGVDHFDLLNETYGSLVTDHIVREIATRIQENLRAHDFVGRVERDEFMIVFRQLASKFETFPLASKIRTAIAEPMRAGTDTETLSPGCGIAQYPANGKTVDELRSFAANAMHTLLIAMRTAGVAAAQENINKARAAVEAAQKTLEEAEAAYEEAVALVAASEASTTAVEAPAPKTEV
jgi:diguanylate cyclase (GGDEF)-like protein